MPIRAVLWDIDDTIFDYTGADRVGLQRHLESEGVPGGYGSATQALDAWRTITDVHWARFAAGETDFQGQRRDRVRSFLGRPLTDAEADDWFARHLAHYEAAWSLFPDALPVLDVLAGELPAGRPVELQHRQSGPQAAHPRGAGPFRGRGVCRGARHLQARGRRVPCRL